MEQNNTQAHDEAAPEVVISTLGVHYAGFWLRVGAVIIDIVIVGVVASALVSFLGEFVGNVVALLAAVLYFSVLESGSWQATVGKKALKIKVTDMEGKRITFGRALGRNLGKIISEIIIGIGYLMAAFTEKKQTLHDMMSNCLVVKEG